MMKYSHNEMLFNNENFMHESHKQNVELRRQNTMKNRNKFISMP
jgi:hypothetical protein